MSKEKTQTWFAVSTDPYGIPGDCMVYNTMKEACRDAPEDLSLEEEKSIYIAKVTVGPRTKMTMVKKVTTKLVEVQLSEDEERG